jgi:chemotaxis methyl-accepting protein methylase
MKIGSDTDLSDFKNLKSLILVLKSKKLEKALIDNLRCNYTAFFRGL